MTIFGSSAYSRKRHYVLGTYFAWLFLALLLVAFKVKVIYHYFADYDQFDVTSGNFWYQRPL